tara:strand:- start:197 stop:955 length:759 start_codon:yes stop_codon:yes gene_type:complete
MISSSHHRFGFKTVSPSKARGIRSVGQKIAVLMLLTFSGCTLNPHLVEHGSWFAEHDLITNERASAFLALDRAFECGRVAQPEAYGWIEEADRMVFVDWDLVFRSRMSVVGTQGARDRVDQLTWDSGRAYVVFVPDASLASVPPSDCTLKAAPSKRFARTVPRLQKRFEERQIIRMLGRDVAAEVVWTRGELENCILMHQTFVRVFRGKQQRLILSLADCGQRYRHYLTQRMYEVRNILESATFNPRVFGKN